MLVGWGLIDTKCLGWAGPRESQWECEVEMWAVGSPLGGGRWALVAGWRTTGGSVESTARVPDAVAALRRGFPGRRGGAASVGQSAGFVRQGCLRRPICHRWVAGESERTSIIPPSSVRYGTWFLSPSLSRTHITMVGA